jgi:branched-chain amino acid aminotransferase
MQLNINGIIQNWPITEEFETIRGLYYGDALFETIRVFDDCIPFLDKHLARLFKGMEAVRFIKPNNWNKEFFEKEILKIAPSNARVRLTVWRKQGGKFLPENNNVHFIIESSELTQSKFSHENNFVTIKKSQRVILVCDAFSNFKTLNAPRYVAAAIEAKELNLDDVIIPNMYGRVGECSSSNIFMVKKNKIITPLLSEGCVDGVLRQIILEIGKKSGFEVIEKSVTFAALKKADEVFLTNSIRGIVSVKAFDEAVFTKNETIFELINLLNNEINAFTFLKKMGIPLDMKPFRFGDRDKKI